MENPNEQHRQRMRTRYRAQGLENFSEHEVLELLLFYCYARCDTKKIAKKFKKFFHLKKNFATRKKILNGRVSNRLATFFNSFGIFIFCGQFFSHFPQALQRFSLILYSK
jgi:glutaminase